MRDKEWNTILAESAAEVLETMFFAEVCGPAQAGDSSAGSYFAARLVFQGTPSGVLTLSISEGLARSLASGFLASDEDDEATVPQLESVVCELSNMICGTLLSRIETEEHFRLSSPQMLPGGAALPEGEFDTPAWPTLIV